MSLIKGRKIGGGQGGIDFVITIPAAWYTCYICQFSAGFYLYCIRPLFPLRAALLISLHPDCETLN